MHALLMGADDIAIKVGSALLVSASFLRVAVELSCWRNFKNAGERLLTVEEVEANERRYIAVTGLFANDGTIRDLTLALS